MAKRVSVAVRVRPILRSGGSAAHQLERFELEAVSRLSDNQLQVAEQKQDEACRRSCFTFDYIFDQESTQLEVYEEAVVDLIDAALAGNNATILAYGQTGSGKTHTMLGDVKPNPLENDLLTSDSGVFLRVLSDLMEYRQKRMDKMHVVVGLSCVEIYNENIRDLFGGNPNDTPPPIRAVMTGDDVALPGLIIKEVTSIQGVFNEIQLAIGRRQSRATDSNSSSSRSHCLFMIDILQQRVVGDNLPPSLSILQQNNNNGDGGNASSNNNVKRKSNASVQQKTAGGMESFNFAGTIINLSEQPNAPIYCSKVLLADLAGSEKPQKSGVTGKGLEEATSINCSLTALGNVVHSLYEGGFVTYRTSNLTRLLRPTFSQASSRVLLLSQVSPTQITFDETISTLHFANKVKAMKVQTTTGAEAESIQFELIEQQKIQDALLADLRIFGKDCGLTPIQRRKFAQKYVSNLYYDLKFRNPYRPNERLQIMTESGVIKAAEKEKVSLKEAKEKEAREYKQNMDNEVKKEIDNMVSQHRNQMNDLKTSLSEIRVEMIDTQVQQLTMNSSFQLVVIQVEEDLAFAQLLISFFKNIKAQYSNNLKSGNDVLINLTNKINSAKSTDAGGSANRDLLAQDDEANKVYAKTAWQHCSGKRFFYALMELRETQLALITTKLSSAEMKNWQSRVGKEVERKKKERGEV